MCAFAARQANAALEPDARYADLVELSTEYSNGPCQPSRDVLNTAANILWLTANATGYRWISCRAFKRMFGSRIQVVPKFDRGLDLDHEALLEHYVHFD